jgi:hypothetical protein
MAELASRPKQKPAPRQKQPTPPVDLLVSPPQATTLAIKPGLEEYCLSLVLAHPYALALANDMLEQQELNGLTVDDFYYGANREIFKSIQLWTASETPKIDTLISMVGEPLEGHLATLVDWWHREPPAPIENIDKNLTIAILRLRLHNLLEQMKELDFLQQEARENNNAQDVRQYMKMAESYKQQRKKLEHTRDALSLISKRRTESSF